MSFKGFAWPWAGVWLLLLGAGVAPAMPSMSVGTTANAPGTTNPVPVNVTIDANVTAFQFNLFIPPDYLSLPGTPIGGSALADHNGQRRGDAGPDPRFGVFVLGLADRPDGVLAYVPFAIAADAPDHDEMLVLSNVLLVSAQLLVVPATVNSNAVLSVTVPPAVQRHLPTNAGAMHLELTGATGPGLCHSGHHDLAFQPWSSLATNTDVTGVLPFDDVSAGALPDRFYRAVFDH